MGQAKHDAFYPLLKTEYCNETRVCSEKGEIVLQNFALICSVLKSKIFAKILETSRKKSELKLDTLYSFYFQTIIKTKRHKFGFTHEL